jgi:16S rRNA (guanine527-N7)-methyltransferase
VALADIAYNPLTEFLSADQRSQLDAFGDMLLAEAMPAGFIGDCSRADLDLRHILDSILPAIAPESKPQFPLHEATGLHVFDLGAGAGLPSLPLAILFPQHTFHLLDAQEKRCRFAIAAAEKLGLSNVKVYHGVVQDFAENHGAKLKADVVIFRAFRKILASLELALHMLPPSATAKVLYWRSQSVPFSEAGLKRVADLGYTIDTFVKFTSAENILPRGLYTFGKKKSAMKPYPRSWKKISADKLVETES